MIHLIHGADLVSSRGFLLKLKERFSRTNVIDCRNLAKGDLGEKIAQENIFAADALVIDWFEEKFLPLGLSGLDKEVIIWSSQTLNDTSWVGKVTHFPARAVSIWKLADAFGLRRAGLSQEYLEKTIYEKSPPEVIISMLARQLKLISLSLSGEASLVSKSDFVRKKIADQALLWNERMIKKGFRALLEADLAIKNGLDPKLVLSLAIAKVVF